MEKNKFPFEMGEKVVYAPENKLYDFGYYSQTKGKCIIYIEGCKNMQDSYVVKIKDLVKAPEHTYPSE